MLKINLSSNVSSVVYRNLAKKRSSTVTNAACSLRRRKSNASEVAKWRDVVIKNNAKEHVGSNLKSKKGNNKNKSAVVCMFLRG